MMKSAPRTALALLVCLVATAACGEAKGPDAPKSHPGNGTVTAVDASARKITLDHEDIPGFMVAMTMTFDVDPGVALEGFEPGTVVDFEVKQDGSRYIVTQLRRAGPPAP